MFQVGDLIKGLPGSSKRYNITNEKMLKGEIVKISNGGSSILIRVIDHINKQYIGRTFWAENSDDQHFSKITDYPKDFKPATEKALLKFLFE